MSDKPWDVRIFGPDVTLESSVEAGGHLADALNAVAENIGVEAGFVCTGAKIGCDSCDATREWDDEGHGWVRTANGYDFCPACIVTTPRRDR